MSVVLDASAVLAYLQREPGSELVREVLPEAVMSTVNWAEVVQKISRADADIPGLRSDLQILGLTLIPFSFEHAEVAGGLLSHTRSLGLSLGGRACLALALAKGAEVYTSDQAWKRLRLELEIKVIR